MAVITVSINTEPFSVRTLVFGSTLHCASKVTLLRIKVRVAFSMLTCNNNYSVENVYSLSKQLTGQYVGGPLGSKKLVFDTFA